MFTVCNRVAELGRMYACAIIRKAHGVQNLTEVRIPWVPRRSVHIVGDAATHEPKRGSRVQGVLVQRSKHGDPCVMDPKDLGLYTKVALGHVVQRQVMRLMVDFSKCRLALEMMFEGIDACQSLGGIECIEADGVPCKCIGIEVVSAVA
jgi:hypothetical protein